MQNAIVFWARLIHAHHAELPHSAAFFKEQFPHVDLENLSAERLILPSNELYKRIKPPVVESSRIHLAAWESSLARIANRRQYCKRPDNRLVL